MCAAILYANGASNTVKVKFTHIINSQQTGGEPASGANNSGDTAQPAEDVGDFIKLPNGDDFETGEMAAPHLHGKVAPYEEIWRQLIPMPAHEQDSGREVSDIAWILESMDAGNAGGAGTKTFYARVGRFYLAVRRTNAADGGPATFSALRQEYSSETKMWRSVYAVGDVTGLSSLVDGELIAAPKLVTASDGTSWNVGEHITVFSGPSNDAAKESCIVRAVGRLDH